MIKQEAVRRVSLCFSAGAFRTDARQPCSCSASLPAPCDGDPSSVCGGSQVESAYNLTRNQATDETEIMHTIDLTDDGFILHPSRFLRKYCYSWLRPTCWWNRHSASEASATRAHGKEAGTCGERRSPTACACSHCGACAGSGVDCDARGLAACR